MSLRCSVRLAIIGSRNIISDLEKYVDADVEEIVSGGAKGVDECAAAYAVKKGIKLVEFLPEYEKYGRAAPIVRNRAIVDYSDEVIAFWDGRSKGTQSVIKYCEKTGKRCRVILCDLP